MSVNSTSPATLFGGTWVQLKDRFLLGAGDTYPNGGTGGEETHTLSSSEMPAHRHWGIEYYGNSGWNVGDNSGLGGTQTVANGKRFTGTFGNSTSMSKWVTAQEGGSNGVTQAHNNMPPYLVVYMWKRTA